jgi:dimeric dUTPase (all-alpha-NTP-PPase superfamily)
VIISNNYIRCENTRIIWKVLAAINGIMKKKEKEFLLTVFSVYLILSFQWMASNKRRSLRKQMYGAN